MHSVIQRITTESRNVGTLMIMDLSILLVCHKYSCSVDNPYLSNDLVNEMRASGERVHVIAVGDVSGHELAQEPTHSDDHCIPFTSNVKYLKYLILWAASIVTFLKVVKATRFQLIVMFAPLTPLLPLALMTRFLKGTKTCIVFDIFPLHQIQIKAIPANLFWPLAKIESFLIRGFDAITGMTPANIALIKKVYERLPSGVTFRVLPPWGSKRDELNKNIDRAHDQ